MKKPAIPALLAALCILFLPACAGGGKLGAIHTISVNTNVERPKTMQFTNQASANVGDFASGAGILPLLVLGAVSKGVTSKPKKEIETAIASRSFAIEQIVPAAVSDELAHSGIFTVVPSGAADATLNIRIIAYGVYHIGSSWTSSLLTPRVFIEPRLVGSDGRIIKVFPPFNGLPPKEDWHLFEQFRDNPELIRIGWEHAAHSAARMMIDQIRKEMPRNQPPAVAPAART